MTESVPLAAERSLIMSAVNPYDEDKAGHSPAHHAARGILYDLMDRRGIKAGLENVDLATRIGIVQMMAEIIRFSDKDKGEPSPTAEPSRKAEVLQHGIDWILKAYDFDPGALRCPDCSAELYVSGIRYSGCRIGGASVSDPKQRIRHSADISCPSCGAVVQYSRSATEGE